MTAKIPYKKNSFFSPSKLFRPEFFGHAEKGLGKKAKVYFKIYDVMDCEASNYNISIARNFKK